MICLGRVVEIVTGTSLATYLERRVFGPLGMKDTGFHPDPARCAPTTPDISGRVHDPLARAYLTPDHQPGNAGLFSTADDLAIFCRALLGGRILKPETVRLMFDPVPGLNRDRRGLGWDIFDEPPWAPGVGHTGVTGSLIWMDPERKRFFILLDNRTFHGEKTVQDRRLREEVVRAVRARN